MTAQAYCSIAITLLMLAGVTLRARPRLHVPMMWTVIVADIALLLWVELGAHAIKRVTGTPIPTALWVHVAIATGLIAGYVVAIIFGLTLKKNPGNARARGIHKRNGVGVVVLRLGLLATTPGIFYDLGGAAG